MRLNPFVILPLLCLIMTMMYGSEKFVLIYPLQTILMLSSHQLAERISTLALEHYSKLQASGKPVVRSNGVQEWTVLACIVAIGEKNDNIRLVSLATGVKATPDRELSRSRGRILHDCHAEILAVRGFNAVLLRQALMLKLSDDITEMDMVQKTTNGFCVKDDLSFALYVSRAPCGDASMELLEEDDTAVWTGSELCQYADPDIKTVLRGRANYKKKGFVRTKPGRKDSNITFSKSCTDKLSCRQVMSLFNSLNWDLFEKPVFLKYMVVPQVSQALDNGLLRAFTTRMENIEGVRHLRIISCPDKFPDDKLDEAQQPALTGAILLNVAPGTPLVQQCIVNGVKNGSFVKNPKPLRKNCETIVSRASQWSLFKKIRLSEEDSTYLDFKSRQVGRNALKLKTRLSLSKDGWVPTKCDDCV
ncbi:LAME_0H20692g1_1 [Lachancea meyersii CBS 8951]|uniref:LAME_0H20692g1_1 n=1 Tax=Lachancea meyersii CBS 8951 TaxID=1266667 RepID=A0A1G4KJK7_9SACH|nr:LAME_0H20692g1_1 [Lachancea meyersii CBS 8951]